MKSNKIITPEVIFMKLLDRLTAKSDELEYIVCVDKHFEKWLQCELLLSFSDIALPVVYDKNFNEILYKDKGYSEKLCDIGIEYLIEAKHLL